MIFNLVGVLAPLQVERQGHEHQLSCHFRATWTISNHNPKSTQTNNIVRENQEIECQRVTSSLTTIHHRHRAHVDTHSISLRCNDPLRDKYSHTLPFYNET